MSVFGLTTEEKPKTTAKKSDDKSAKKSPSGSQDEAKALLEKMKAKNDSGDCAFC